MLIYLDMCCLKRPFDDQSQPRIRLESEAVLGLLSCEPESARFVRSPALLLENAQNPVAERAARVHAWLAAQPLWQPDPNRLRERTADLMRLGLKNFDALHVASAEQIGADAFSTCDDRLLHLAKREPSRLQVRIVGIIDLAREILT
jgi:predicted nucleic acid-binding protein